MKALTSKGSRRAEHVLASAVLLVLSGCGGASDGPGSSPMNSTGGGNMNGGGGGEANKPQCDRPSPGAAPIRRLTRFEYNNTVRDLLGDTTRAGDLLPPELKGNGFSNDAASLTTSRVLVDAYRSAAITLATNATRDAAALAQLTTCDAAVMGEAACAQAFIADFGARAFRRPLEPTESTALLETYEIGKQGTTHADGLKAVIEMVLQAPQFLYRPEFGTSVAGQGVARPTSYEMATRLSYLLWGSAPDPSLLQVASAGGLDTPEQIAAQAELMLQDARAKDVVRFFTSTLYGINGLDGLERDAASFPTFVPGMGALFRQETERFIEDVVWNGAGDFATLFNAPYTFVNGALATYYGIAGVTGDAFERVELDSVKRRGLLTQASILASTTPGSRNNPVVRGKFVYEDLFCGHVPSPPVGLNAVEPPPDPTRTTRERFSVHRENDACRGCHAMLDPIGFGLENYDGAGLWRDMENGKPIDASGEIPDGDAAGPFNGPMELTEKIAKSETARSCFAAKWLDFAYARVASDQDACTKAQLEAAFRGAGGNVKALLKAATQTDAFLYLPLPAP